MEATYYSTGSEGAARMPQEYERLEDFFIYDPEQVPLTSSGRKRVLKGKYQPDERGEGTPACALVYSDEEFVAFGAECANLGTCSLMGVGPRMLGIFKARVGDDPIARPIVIEEDAGKSLAQLLQEEGGSVLHPLGTKEREAENDKIAFDVYSQILNAHREGLFHRDLRCENVCVRRFGDKPQDIKATVIDIELGAGIESGKPGQRAELYDTLFRTVPSYLAGGNSRPASEAVIVPNVLELDLGYLSALLFHLKQGRMALNSRNADAKTLQSFLGFLDQEIKYFGYVKQTLSLRVRRLDPEEEIKPLALSLGLKEVSGKSFETDELLRQAETYHRLYLDDEDLGHFRKSAAAKMHAIIDDLVRIKFEQYKERRRTQGKPVEYERVEDQPEDLQSSNYDQMAHVLTKVAALGYVTKEIGVCGPGERIVAFSDEQIELLSRMEHARWVDERLRKGWRLGERSHEAKTSPYLIPYDDLSEEMKDYDRDAARSVIPLLEKVGIAVAKP